MDFRQAYQGFNEALPGGNLPKINDKDDDKSEGSYDLEVISTEAFNSHKTGGVSFKAEVRVLDCNNGRFKAGTAAAVMIHGLSHAKEYNKKLAFGNLKDFLAAAISSKYNTNISPTDETAGGDDWIEWAAQASGVPETLSGARVRVQCTFDTARDSKHRFVKMKWYPLPAAEKAA